jgi:acyl homoserine lactone synthase
MQNVTVGTANSVGPVVAQDLAAYRHKVFIERLGWDLPVLDNLELDQFDRPDTIYVIRRDESGEICGCGRLLPTTSPYLLSEIFPQLMGDVPVPRDCTVWELSRFSAAPIGATMSLEEQKENTHELLRAAVQVADQHGAKRLITVSPLGIERLLRRMGVHSHRVAAPSLVDGKPVFACWIEIDNQTRAALNIPLDTKEMEPQGATH